MESLASFRRRIARLTPVAVAAVALVGTSAAAPAANAAAAAPRGWPTVRLYAPALHQKVAVYGNVSFIDPSIYVEAIGSALQFDVQRRNFSRPVTITQIIRAAGVTQRRELGSWALDGWRGLRRFLRLTITSSAGKVIASRLMTFCPDSFDPQRAGPDSAIASPYPYFCGGQTPFVLGTVWGIARGWGVDPLTSGQAGMSARLQVGKTYTATMTITSAWRRELRITPRDAIATVHLRAVKPSQCNPCTFRAPAQRALQGGSAAGQHETAAAVQRVPTMASPPRSVLPDLKPLPSWGIGVLNNPQTTQQQATAQLAFGATVAVLGNGPLDVEAFSTHHAAIMPAYQYFWRGNHVVGRVRAGTMGFDSKRGHDHWHFEQFAQYRLLGRDKKLVLRSRKVGFCIAPTDGVNLLVAHATWQPSYTGFGGQCGSPGALWVQEKMPLGWGDTYFQFAAGQSFNITSLPDGVYYIEIIANPEHVLHETSVSNDISLRKIIIGGTHGHRTVRVPAYHGIDPER